MGWTQFRKAKAMVIPATGGFDVERASAARARIRYNEIKDELEGLRVQVESPDKSVAIELGAGGAILGIRLRDSAMEKRPRALSEELLRTINAGVQQVAEMTNELVGQFLSRPDSDLAAVTSGRLPDRLIPPEKSDLAKEIEAASAIPKTTGRRKRPSVRSYVTRPTEAADPTDPDVAKGA